MAKDYFELGARVDTTGIKDSLREISSTIANSKEMQAAFDKQYRAIEGRFKIIEDRIKNIAALMGETKDPNLLVGYVEQVKQMSSQMEQFKQDILGLKSGLVGLSEQLKIDSSAFSADGMVEQFRKTKTEANGLIQELGKMVDVATIASNKISTMFEGKDTRGADLETQKKRVQSIQILLNSTQKLQQRMRSQEKNVSESLRSVYDQVDDISEDKLQSIETYQAKIKNLYTQFTELMGNFNTLTGNVRQLDTALQNTKKYPEGSEDRLNILATRESILSQMQAMAPKIEKAGNDLERAYAEYSIKDNKGAEKFLKENRKSFSALGTDADFSVYIQKSFDSIVKSLDSYITVYGRKLADAKKQKEELEKQFVSSDQALVNFKDGAVQIPIAIKGTAQQLVEAAEELVTKANIALEKRPVIVKFQPVTEIDRTKGSVETFAKEITQSVNAAYQKAADEQNKIIEKANEGLTKRDANYIPKVESTSIAKEVHSIEELTQGIGSFKDLTDAIQRVTKALGQVKAKPLQDVESAMKALSEVSPQLANDLEKIDFANISSSLDHLREVLRSMKMEMKSTDFLNAWKKVSDKVNEFAPFNKDTNQREWQQEAIANDQKGYQARLYQLKQFIDEYNQITPEPFRKSLADLPGMGVALDEYGTTYANILEGVLAQIKISEKKNPFTVLLEDLTRLEAETPKIQEAVAPLLAMLHGQPSEEGSKSFLDQLQSVNFEKLTSASNSLRKLVDAVNNATMTLAQYLGVDGSIDYEQLSRGVTGATDAVVAAKRGSSGKSGLKSTGLLDDDAETKAVLAGLVQARSRLETRLQSNIIAMTNSVRTFESQGRNPAAQLDYQALEQRQQRLLAAIRENEKEFEETLSEVADKDAADKISAFYDNAIQRVLNYYQDRREDASNRTLGNRERLANKFEMSQVNSIWRKYDTQNQKFTDNAGNIISSIPGAQQWAQIQQEAEAIRAATSNDDVWSITTEEYIQRVQGLGQLIAQLTDYVKQYEKLKGQFADIQNLPQLTANTKYATTASGDKLDLSTATSSENEKLRKLALERENIVEEFQRINKQFESGDVSETTMQDAQALMARASAWDTQRSDLIQAISNRQQEQLKAAESMKQTADATIQQLQSVFSGEKLDTSRLHSSAAIDAFKEINDLWDQLQKRAYSNNEGGFVQAIIGKTGNITPNFRDYINLINQLQSALERLFNLEGFAGRNDKALKVLTEGNFLPNTDIRSGLAQIKDGRPGQAEQYLTQKEQSELKGLLDVRQGFIDEWNRLNTEFQSGNMTQQLLNDVQNLATAKTQWTNQFDNFIKEVVSKRSAVKESVDALTQSASQTLERLQSVLSGESLDTTRLHSNAAINAFTEIQNLWSELTQRRVYTDDQGGFIQRIIGRTGSITPNFRDYIKLIDQLRTSLERLFELENFAGKNDRFLKVLENTGAQGSAMSMSGINQRLSQLEGGTSGRVSQYLTNEEQTQLNGLLTERDQFIQEWTRVNAEFQAGGLGQQLANDLQSLSIAKTAWLNEFDSLIQGIESRQGKIREQVQKLDVGVQESLDIISKFQSGSLVDTTRLTSTEGIRQYEDLLQVVNELQASSTGASVLGFAGDPLKDLEGYREYAGQLQDIVKLIQTWANAQVAAQERQRGEIQMTTQALNEQKQAIADDNIIDISKNWAQTDKSGEWSKLLASFEDRAKQLADLQSRYFGADGTFFGDTTKWEGVKQEIIDASNMLGNAVQDMHQAYNAVVNEINQIQTRMNGGVQGPQQLSYDPQFLTDDQRARLEFLNEDIREFNKVLGETNEAIAKSGGSPELLRKLRTLEDGYNHAQQAVRNFEDEIARGQASAIQAQGNKIEGLKKQIDDLLESYGSADVSKLPFLQRGGVTEALGDLQAIKVVLSQIDTSKIMSEGDAARVDDFTQKIKQAQQVLQTAFGSKETNDIGTAVANTINQLTYRYLSFYAIFNKFTSSIRGGYDALKEYDKALTNIKYTMDLTEGQFDALGQSTVQMARDLKTSINDAMQISQIYANMRTTPEEILTIARPTAVLSNLASISTEEASNEIQSVMQQFQLAEDQAEHIVDVYDKISASIKMDYAN